MNDSSTDVSTCIVTDEMLRRQAIEVLTELAGGMIRHLYDGPLDSWRGGMTCPADLAIHGNSSYAVLPFAYLYLETKEQRYLDAAKANISFILRHQGTPGFWNNDVTTTWKGTTAFVLMGLARSYQLFSSAQVLSADDTAQLRHAITRAADWLIDNVSAEQWVTNYIFSSGMALQQAFEVTGAPRHADAAARWICEGMSRINEEGLIYGEWVDHHEAERGVVDPGYNLEMSLPSLTIYALQTRNTECLDAALKVLEGHLPFLAPDGALDVGWGSRGYKWAYLGSRTAHGVCMGLLPLVGLIPSLGSFVEKHLALMRSMLKDGILGNGVGFWEQEAYQPCLIPTITKAAGLALGLLYMGQPLPATKPSPAFPEKAVWLLDSANVAVVRTGGMSISISSTHYRTGLPLGRVVPPTGGTTTLLWHPQAGPIQLASQGIYERVEHQNMPEVPEACVASPRIEWRGANGVYSNIFDYQATMRVVTAREQLPCCIEVIGRLCHGRNSKPGQAYRIDYTISDEFVEKCYMLTSVADDGQYVLVEPLVIHPRDEVQQTDASVTINGPTRRVVLTVGGNDAGVSVEASLRCLPRAWTPFPGVWVVPVEITLLPQPGIAPVAKVRLREKTT